MHWRTLNRRLEAEGATFQETLDRVRLAMAKESEKLRPSLVRNRRRSGLRAHRRVLFGSVSEAVHALMLDVALMAAANILIFSVWYSVIDPPGVEETARADEPRDFLFPQRGSALPRYEAWVPRYADYLFVAFTTSFAFSPTDTAPLTRRAKMLMLAQAGVSIITLTGVAGSAINILAAAK